MYFYTFLDTMVMMTSVCLVLMVLHIWTFYHGIYDVFYRITQACRHNYNSPVDPTVYARLSELHISRYDWRGCRGGRGNFPGEVVMVAMILRIQHTIIIIIV